MSSLIEFFSDFRGKRILYYPNPGNAGDSFITVSTIDFFRKNNIDFEIFYGGNVKNSVIVYGGGGSFWTGSSVPLDFLRKYSPCELGNVVVVLPQTFWGNEDLFSIMGENVHFFCREKISFEYMKNICVNAKTYLDQDMAFYMDVEYWLSRHSLSSLIFGSPSRLLKAVRRWFLYKKVAGSGDVLTVVRTDREKAEHDWGDLSNSVDLSRVFSLGTKKESYANVSAWFFLNFINKFKVVKTDRLHVAIAAAMLGKNVTMYGNAYFKSKAIFDHSIDEKFKNVKFQDGA